ncbi:MAG: NADH-ubiquinone oxidoreductase-F iron-sulfur binding region domain-containing protein [Candidatus Dormibacteria bacterium]
MDLRLGVGGVATVAERAAVDSVLGPPESAWEGGDRTAASGHLARGGHSARARRHLLLPALQVVQAHQGWVTPGALDYICTRLTVPPAEAYGVAAFYSLLRTDAASPTVVHICDDIACRSQGAETLCEQMTARFGPESQSTGAVSWMRSPCLGRCEQGSAALIQRSGGEAPVRGLAPVTLPKIEHALDGGNGRTPMLNPESPVRSPAESRRLLRRVDVVDPRSLSSYRAHGGYQALRRALDMGPQGVIREVKDAKLLGRGGAAFPTGVKWEAVANNPVRPHYFICNADESEPGTFKDRVLMERDPFGVIEALTVAGYATGATQGYVYIRGEYPEAADLLLGAVGQARAHGFLGPAIMGAEFTFDVEVRRGSGAYIAGEETALFSSLEGRRPEPRNKPPFPTQAGLFGKPTGINNVETLANVLEVLRIGGPAFAALGTPDSTGTRLFCLSGCVERPGLYELEFGATLRELLELAGGVRNGGRLRAILLGGAAGSFVGPDALDTRLTFEAMREIGATLGSGVVLVLDDTVEMPDILRRIAQFFRDESCGQCVPCRVGTVRQEELLARLARGAPLGSEEQELGLLDELAQVMRDASICGLGQTASAAIQSALRQGLLGAGQPGLNQRGPT